MKRVISIILCIALAFVIAGCAEKNIEAVKTPVDTVETESSAAAEQESPQSIPEQVVVHPQASSENQSAPTSQVPLDSNKVLVAYFSRTGTTKPLAECAAEYLNADIFEIQAAVPYTDADIAYYTNCRANSEQSDPSARPEIAGSVSNISQYDTVVIGYPIWHGQAPKIIYTFLESYDFSGKTIIPFCTSNSSGIGSSDTNLHPLVSSTASWVSGKRFAAGTDKGAIIEWLKQVSPKNYEKKQEVNTSMKLYINDKEVPVTWEENASVEELIEEVSKGNITVQMSMYGGNEQVGSLGKRYKSNDKQTTTHNGDIVLYSSSNIVVFYGSNSWAYTRLGKMNLTESEVTSLLSNGDVVLTLKN